MASPQSCPGLTTPPPPPPRNTSRERPSCFAPPSPPSGPGLVDESVASGQHNAAYWTGQLSKTSKLLTVKCQRMSKTWQHDMPQHSWGADWWGGVTGWIPGGLLRRWTWRFCHLEALRSRRHLRGLLDVTCCMVYMYHSLLAVGL